MKGSVVRYRRTSSPGRTERLGEGLLAERRGPRERELQHEQLVERETRPARLGFGRGRRAMEGRERVVPEREGLACAQLGRKGLTRVAHEAESLCAEVAEPLLRHVLAGGVDGREVGGLRLSLQVVGRDREAELVRPAP